MTDNQLSEQIENQYEWAQDAVSQEWHMYEIAKRDGYFAATEAAKTTRLVAMTLELAGLVRRPSSTKGASPVVAPMTLEWKDPYPGHGPRADRDRPVGATIAALGGVCYGKGQNSTVRKISP